MCSSLPLIQKGSSSMKTLTKEQIDKAIEEATNSLTQNIVEDYCNASKLITEESKDNPIAYHIIAISVAQSNTINIMREVFYKLLIE